MGSRFREQLTQWTDPTVFSQPDQWTGFLSAMVTAHEADLLYMRNFLEEITKNKYNQGGLTLKDLKPDTFESNEKSKLSFRLWSDEFSSWVERIDQDFETLLRLAAQMQEWDKDKFIAEAQELSKKVINLLRHNQTLQREDDGGNSILENLKFFFEIIIHKYKFGLTIVGKLVWQQEEVRKEDVSIALMILEEFFTSVLFRDILEAISLILRYRTMCWLELEYSLTSTT